MIAPAARPAAALGRSIRPSELVRLARRAAWLAALLGAAALVALLEPAPLAATVAGALAVGIVLAKPLAGVGLLLFAVPFGSLATVEVGDFSITPTEPLVALVALAWVAQGVTSGRVVIRGSAVLASAGLLALLALFSVTYAGAVGPAVKESLKWLELLLVLVVVRDRVRDRRTAAGLVAALFAAGSAEALYGVFQFATNRGPASFGVAGNLRAFGNFEQPNPFAGYLATILPLAVALALAPGERHAGRGRLLAAGAALALAAGIALSQSRGAWLGLVVAGAVFLLVWSHRARLLLAPAAGLAVLVVVLALAGLVPGSVGARLAQTLENFGIFDVRTVELTPENYAIVERMAHWQAAWAMFLDNPWLGVGAGNYASAYPSYYVPPWLDPLGHAHNYYLNMLAELGVLGLGLLLLFLGATFRTLGAGLAGARDASPEARDFWRPLLVGVLAALVVYATHNLFDNLFVHSVNVQLGVLLALGLVAAERLRAEGRPVRGA